MSTDTLLDVVDDLTAGRNVTTVLGDGTKHIEHHTALIAQLRDAVAANVTGGNGVPGSSTRIPINADALEKYQTIEGTILTWYADAGLGVPGMYPEENLRALYAHRWQLTPDDDAEFEVRGWRRLILDQFDPPKQFRVETPCPVCKARTYFTANGDLDTWPLEVTMRGNDLTTARARCLNPDCAVDWDTLESIEELGGELRATGHIVPCTAVDEWGSACTRTADHEPEKHHDRHGNWMTTSEPHVDGSNHA